MRPATKIESSPVGFRSRLTRVASLIACTAIFSFGNFNESVAQKQKSGADRFIYKPIRREFWAKVDLLINTKRPLLVLQERLPKDATNAETDEWKLGLARGLVASGQPIHAQYLLTQVASKSIGTRQSFEALRMISEIARAGSVDETYLEELAFDLDTKVDETESRSMIGYFRARALLRKGYPEWAQHAISDISPSSTWNDELVYDRSIQALNAGDSANAYTKFEALTKSSVTRVPTAKLAKLALARLIFERKDFKASIATYLTIDLPTRERARTLNELAWSYYYSRSYGKALGAIRALKSPYYFPLLSPETFILESLIYRELCHYKRVKSIVAEFLHTYKAVFNSIEERRPLDKLTQVIQMALQEGVMQRRAVAIQNVRMERRQIEGQKWADSTLQNFLLKLGEKREHIADAEITRIIRTRTDALANWFLDLREQIWFLDYEASIRMIQLNDELAEQYEPPKASKTRPDIIFWPVNDEAWKDELFDYETLVGDSCKGSPMQNLYSPPRSNGGQ